MHLLTCDRTACQSKKDMADEDDFDGWLVVHSMSSDDDRAKHYCSKDCAVQDMAGFEIPEGIPQHE